MQSMAEKSQWNYIFFRSKWLPKKRICNSRTTPPKLTSNFRKFTSSVLLLRHIFILLAIMLTLMYYGKIHEMLIPSKRKKKLSSSSHWRAPIRELTFVRATLYGKHSNSGWKQFNCRTRKNSEHFAALSQQRHGKIHQKWLCFLSTAKLNASAYFWWCNSLLANSTVFQIRISFRFSHAHFVVDSWSA